MTEKIGLPIRKLIENISLYPVIGQTKTKKLRLTGLENQTQCHHSLTPHHTILHRKKRGCNILFNFAKKKNPICYFCTCDSLARNAGGSKKNALPLFLSVNI
jgi:recombinational DNA repair protein RecR